MADTFKGILDQWGNPIIKSTLSEEIAASSITGVRSPVTGYPGDGLDPERLARILRDADAGNPVAYLELAETIEERDLHYVGVMGTRKRSVCQLEITVDAHSEDEKHQAQAKMVRDWLDRDELADELFDIMDATGKGISFTEIIWDTSEGQYKPDRLEYRDPRWFRFDQRNGKTPLMLDDGGREMPLPGFKFIQCVMKAKSGLPIRSGLARIVVWAWMFKAFTQRDWAIFTQTYGQPVRIGKYGPGTNADDRSTLYRAVANIAGDCAAIIPESMSIDFVEAKGLGTGHSNYMERSNWLDQQVSKAVLGQTATTDAIAGGYGVGKSHRLVQEDIERSDAKSLSAIINRDLVRPWIMMEYGPQDGYPRLRIGRAEDTDVELIVESVAKMVPLGLRVGRKQMSDMIGIGEPEEDDELLTAPSKAAPQDAPPIGDDTKQKKTPALKMLEAAMAEINVPAGQRRQPLDAIAEAGATGANDSVGDMVAAIRALIDNVSSLDELKLALAEAGPDLNLADLEASMAQTMLLAELTGRAEIDRGDNG